MATTEPVKKKIARPTAEKRLLQNKKKRLINKSFKSQVRTAIRNFDNSLQDGNPTTIQECLNAVYSMMDKGVKRGIYKKNKANRTKARFTARAAVKSA